MKKTIKMTERELHRLISESVKRVLNESFCGNLQSMITAEAMDQLSQYNDLDIISDNCINSVMNNGYFKGNDLAFSYENGELVLECISGMTELCSVNCNIRDEQDVIQAMAKCINNGVMNY